MTASISAAEYRQIVANDMPERGSDGLQNRVRELVRDLGLLDGYIHTWDSRKSSPGYPDCHIVIDERQIFIELKRQNERKHPPSPDQIEWLNRLRRVPHNEVYLFRPIDLLDDTIRHVLTVGPLPDRLWQIALT